jgi:hypothetical protein
MGYGFVDFLDHQTAQLAMTSLNGRELYGQELRINWASAGMKDDTGGTICLYNLLFLLVVLICFDWNPMH